MSEWLMYSSWLLEICTVYATGDEEQRLLTQWMLNTEYECL